MASSSQLKALLRAHLDGDDAHFYSIAMQLAAHEARLGHGKLAQELRELIDKAKEKQGGSAVEAIPIAQPRGELAGLLSVTYPKLRLSDIVLSPETLQRFERLVKEQRHLGKIRSYGLAPRKKLLLLGPPGTGKTLTASVLAGELNLPLFVVRLDSLMTKFMGETAAKLRLIFDSIRQMRGVYLFDEFDSVGSQRGLSNDVGEIRRVLNSFLQLIEQDTSDGLILAATNHPEILDHALFRRFDDVIEYRLPSKQQIISILKSRLATFKKRNIDWSTLAQAANGLSYGDIVRSCEEAIKDAIIHDREEIVAGDVMKTIKERQAIHQK